MATWHHQNPSRRDKEYFVSIIGAYIGLSPGESPPQEGYDNIQEGYYRGRTPEGLDVYFMGEDTGEGPPEDAQVYLYWEPKVVAVWNDEEAENGEDREVTDGSDVEQRDEAVPAESGVGAGEGSEGDGDVPASRAEGQPEEAE